ncbi:hypothetical protein Gogos_004925, partial [Gossypium gossypioides]|nr:hypothetical protein [Gossypium gossypioides]
VWLPEDLIQHIVGIPPPHSSEGLDSLSWSHTSTAAFSIKTWHLWKNRNVFIFQRKTWSSSETIKLSISWAKQFSSVFKNELMEGYEFSVGEQLIGGWTFLNTDGAVQKKSRNAAAGGVICDENGN